MDSYEKSEDSFLIEKKKIQLFPDNSAYLTYMFQYLLAKYYVQKL